jgi:phenylalanyl-tRNA synthetase beta chain
MRVPLGWLRELVNDLPPEGTLADLLAGLGLGVERLEVTPAAPSGVLVARIESIEALAGSDHLLRAHINAGSGLHSVVCGAPNARPGLLTAYAPPGVTLPGMTEPLARREVAGVPSEGMLCSPRELGLYDYGGGLIEFAEDTEPGDQLADLWPADAVLELELTPNRADAFSLLGVARDVAAKLAVPLQHPAAGLEGAAADPQLDDGLEVRIGAAERCPRLLLRRVDGVRVGPSPLWLQRRLAQLGLRPRNVVVDITNLVTFELGQPSHAYDLRALQQGVLEVRRARPAETFVSLSDETLTLDPDDLVIATPDADGGSRAIGLAGVIGGRDDSVSESTVSVAIEVASFEATGVRRTARRHKQVTDARIRFERGVDPGITELASARVASLLALHAGGRVHPGVSAAGVGVGRPAAIRYRPTQVEFLMALTIPEAEQRSTLERLGFEVAVTAPDEWSVTPPSWRMDATLEVDLIEEVSRMHGFEHIGSSVPDLAFVPPASDPTHRRLRERLVGAGMIETMGYVFTSDEELARARVAAATVRLSEPQGIERSVLRTALLPGLLGVARLNRDAPRLALFEIGRVFGAEEEERLALLWRGEGASSGWRPAQASDVYTAKGQLESLAEGFAAQLSLRPSPFDEFHPGISAEVVWDGVVVGRFGRVHPEIAAAWECGAVTYAELRLPLSVHPPVLRELPRQPFAERDLAVVIPESVPYLVLAETCQAAAGERLAELYPFDVYRGPQVAEGEKSVALRFRFRDRQRALTDAEVDTEMQAVMDALRARGYRWRA